MPKFTFDVFVLCHSTERYSVTVEAADEEAARQAISDSCDNGQEDTPAVKWSETLDDEVTLRELDEMQLRETEALR